MTKPTKCERCGRENDPSLAYCLDCGTSLRGPAPTAALCPACGAPIQPGFRFCGGCGKPVSTAPKGAPRVTASSPGEAARFRLEAVRTDGLPGPTFRLEKDEVVCGRSEGDIRIPDDATVSPRHARFTRAGAILRVEDLASVNGTYLRLREPRHIAPGQEIRIGHQLLRLDPAAPPSASDDGLRPWGTRNPGHAFRLSQLLEGGGAGEVFPLREGENAIGREAGEVTFPSDPFVSARHARIDVAGGEAILSDAGSSNGTFLRISGATEVSAGDLILVGAQLLKVD